MLYIIIIYINIELIHRKSGGGLAIITTKYTTLLQHSPRTNSFKTATTLIDLHTLPTGSQRVPPVDPYPWIHGSAKQQRWT